MKKKTKLFLLLIILNLDLLLILNIQSRSTLQSISNNLGSELLKYSDVSAAELKPSLSRILNSYPELSLKCFDKAFEKNKIYDSAKLFDIENDLVLKLEYDGIHFKYSCQSGEEIIEFGGSKSKYKTASIVIDGFVWDQVLKQTSNFELTYEVLEILTNFDDMTTRPIKCTLKIIYQENTKQNLIKINALSYKKSKEKEKIVFHSKEQMNIKYYDMDFNLISSYSNKSPIKFGLLTSRYDKNRLHPITKEKKPHFGTDYAATLGEPIYAIQSGKIEVMKFKRNNGNYVKINHGMATKSQYLHLDKFKKNLQEGDFVHKNDIIGYVGKTGLATDPHVCYRFWYNGRQVNHRSHKDKLTRMPSQLIEKEKLNQNELLKKLNQL